MIHRSPEPPFPKPHRYPEALPRSAAFRVLVDGIPLDVLHHPAAHHASFECGGPVEVEIERLRPVRVSGQVFVRPLVRGIVPEVSENRIRFVVAHPQHLQIEIEGEPLLYLYAQPFAVPAPTGPHVRLFEGGRIHEAGLVSLRDGEVCWIEAGAVVRGSIRADHASGVRIGGYGILDGSYWTEGTGHGRGHPRKALVLDCCTGAVVEDLLMVGPCQWMVVLGGCEHVEVRGIRQIAREMSSDGIDIVGSRHVRVSGCCLHNGDDNIAIKALHNVSSPEDRVVPGLPVEDWKGTVEDIVVSGSVFYNIHGGSAMEIGYETSTDHIRDIRFEDIDVLAVHEFGSVFGIHNGDRARVENVTWDDIRVEHHFDTLVDFRTLKARWNLDAERGTVHNVTLRNIRVAKSPYNDGYTVSILSGYDAAHPVTGVVFENFELGGVVVGDADQLDLVTRHAHGIVFR